MSLISRLKWLETDFRVSFWNDPTRRFSKKYFSYLRKKIAECHSGMRIICNLDSFWRIFTSFTLKLRIFLRFVKSTVFRPASTAGSLELGLTATVPRFFFGGGEGDVESGFFFLAVALRFFASGVVKSSVTGAAGWVEGLCPTASAAGAAEAPAASKSS